MYCTKCGREAATGDRYCASCGTRLRTEEKNGRVGFRNRRIPVIATAIGAVLLTIGLALLPGKRPEPQLQQPIASSPGETAEPTRQTETAEPTEATYATPPETLPEPQTIPTEAEDPESPLYLAEEIWVQGGVTTRLAYDYDETGRLIRKDTGDGYVHTYSYRADGTLEKEGLAWCGEPAGVILCDERGNPRQESDLEGVVCSYENTYDQQNRLVSSQKRNASGELLEERRYAYSEDGGYELDYIDHVEGLLHCNVYTRYDAQGRILEEHQSLEEGFPVTYLTEHTYDAFGDLEKTVYTCKNDEMQIHTVTEYLHTRQENGLPVSTEIYVTTRQNIRGEAADYPRTLEKTILYTYDDLHRKIGEEHRGLNGWTDTYLWEYDSRGSLIRHSQGDAVTVTYIYRSLG